MLNAIHIYRMAFWLKQRRIPLLPRLLTLLIFLLYNSKVPATARIGKGSLLGYGGIGVVIHDRAVIGEGVMIGPNVTIGGRSGHHEVPVIGDHVEISTGAKVLGPVRIGNHVIIGANAVVIKDVPDHAVVAGVPARIIRIQQNDN
ncbi:serine O-acetyltransferase [Chitinophaga cymbidii]|nr:DapH/DapD/GlmU-related protein [Chitinophaga cymbidii]